MKTLHNMKFRILSPEHSEEIQRELFRLGYWWLGKTGMFKYMDKPFIYTNGMVISYGVLLFAFKKHRNTETTLEELKAM